MAVSRCGIVGLGVFGLLAACERPEPEPRNPNVMSLEIGASKRRLADARAAVEKAVPPERDRAELPPAALPPLPRYAKLRQGETLSQLAARKLGSSRRWREIAELNGIEDPSRLSAGMRLRLPPE